MSTVIKSTDSAHGLVIKNFGSAAMLTAGFKNADVIVKESPLIAENKRLVGLLKSQTVEIAAHGDAVAEAFAKGEEAGRIAMEAEIDEDRAASLVLLSEGIEAAKSKLEQSLENSESIALVVAQMALEKMFGAGEERKSAVVDLIRHQFRKIGYDSFVALEVSRSDFPDTDEVANLALALSISPDMIRVSQELSRGDCNMRMQLGTLDVGLDRQRGSIRSLLAEMATADEAQEVG